MTRNIISILIQDLEDFKERHAARRVMDFVASSLIGMRTHILRRSRQVFLAHFVILFFTPGAWAFDHSHKTWGKVLKLSVVEAGHGSRVDYEKVKREPTALNDYLAQIEAVTREEYSKFSEGQKLAFFIDAYNALTVKLIVDHYPVKSIRDIGGLFSNPWKMKFFTLFGEKQNLDHIEHDLLRKDFAEPRIHFALVCASKGCPALSREPFIEANLGQQLNDAERRFLTDTARNRFDGTTNTLYLSSIFKWYGGDFEKKFDSLKGYLAPRMSGDPKVRVAIESPSTKIEYLDYDWLLNKTD